MYNKLYVLLKKQKRIKRQTSVCLSSLQYVVLSADKVSYNIGLVWKSYYYECLIKEFGISNHSTKILFLTKKKFWQVTSHLCHQWIFQLMRNMMTYIHFCTLYWITKLPQNTYIKCLFFVLFNKRTVYITMTKICR